MTLCNITILSKYCVLVCRDVLFDEKLISVAERQLLIDSLPDIDKVKLLDKERQKLDPLANIQIKSWIEHFLELLRDGNLERASRPKWERTVKSLNFLADGNPSSTNASDNCRKQKSDSEESVCERDIKLWWKMASVHVKNEQMEGLAGAASSSDVTPSVKSALALPDAILAIEGLCKLTK